MVWATASRQIQILMAFEKALCSKRWRQWQSLQWIGSSDSLTIITSNTIRMQWTWWQNCVGVLLYILLLCEYYMFLKYIQLRNQHGWKDHQSSTILILYNSSIKKKLILKNIHFRKNIMLSTSVLSTKTVPNNNNTVQTVVSPRNKVFVFHSWMNQLFWTIRFLWMI